MVHNYFEHCFEKMQQNWNFMHIALQTKFTVVGVVRPAALKIFKKIEEFSRYPKSTKTNLKILIFSSFQNPKDLESRNKILSEVSNKTFSP